MASRTPPPRFASLLAAALLLAAAACADGTRLTGVDLDAPLPAFATLPTSDDAIDLGRSLFFDENLSRNANQSCASCHGPDWGFSGPDPVINADGSVYEGSIPGAFGNRRPPSAAYATPSPVLHYAKDGGGLWVGGNFWDGRATGEILGNPAADQAQGPFLNPKEQALADDACVVYFVSVGSYSDLFLTVWGDAIASVDYGADPETTCRNGGMLSLSGDDRAITDEAYDQIGLTIAAYEASAEVNAFSSKFDAYNRHEATLTRLEKKGLSVFKGKGKCARCHSVNGQEPLFTDFTYDNLGVPANPENPALLAEGFVDYGLGGFLDDEEEWGKVKVPTLRNVDKRVDSGTKSYMHNGVFRSLEEVVHFYNTRDDLDECAPGVSRDDAAWGVTCWPPPEVEENVNESELGSLHLTAKDEAALVAFLKTLSDGWGG
jgi:cytochrome c peroxidase